MNTKDHIHHNQPVIRLGTEEENASQAVILLHGRGSTAQAMIPLAEEITAAQEVIFIIPQAAKNRWYPKTAFGPLEANEPDLSSALQKIKELTEELIKKGISRNRIYIGGFSQGACLAAEFVARNPGKYGGVFILSGALIGPEGSPREYTGSLADMPVFIGCSDMDPWIPQGVVDQTAKVFRELGAAVEMRIYPGLGHTVNADEIQAVRNLLGS